VSLEKQFRPTLAATASWEDYDRIFQSGQYLLASCKLDGIRCLMRGEDKQRPAVSRTLKPIPNYYVQKLLSKMPVDSWGLDGELIVGKAYGEGVFARTSSGVMSYAGEPDFTYYVFDHFGFMSSYQEQFQGRHDLLVGEICFESGWAGYVQVLPQTIVHNLEELQKLEEEAAAQGYEGLILRHPDSPYKYGRSTLREQYMLKLKRFLDSEATIIDFEPLRHNMNEAEIDNLGHTKRSSVKANKIEADELGAFVVEDPELKMMFNIGTGFDAAQRIHYWAHRDQLMGKTVKYKYLPVGTLDAPRHPVFLGFRDPQDL
jgi:DNA ligase 1